MKSVGHGAAIAPDWGGPLVQPGGGSAHHPPRRGRSRLWLTPGAALFGMLLAAAAWGASKTRQSPAAPRSSEGIALERVRERVLKAKTLGMFYYSDDPLGLAALQAHGPDMTLLGPQCYAFDPNGTVSGLLPPGVLDAARAADLPLMPLIVNPGFDRGIAHALLHSPLAQARVARSLAEIAEQEEYVGWQLDIEYIAPADKYAYTRFVARVAARLHQDHRLLSVAVVPRFSDVYPDRSANRFHTGEWGAPFDYRGLARVADFLVLMTYDQHTSGTPPGPVAGYDWVKAALAYAVRRVPPSKLLLGIPFYSRAWAETAGATTSRSLGYLDVDQFFGGTEGDRHWDEASRTNWMKLQDGDTLRTVWFDDARSLHEKLGLVPLYHLRGYAAWRLGEEDPDFWLATTKDK